MYNSYQKKWWMIICIYFYIISTSILYISVVADLTKTDLYACLPQMIPAYVNEFQYLAVDGTK